MNFLKNLILKFSGKKLLSVDYIWTVLYTYSIQDALLAGLTNTNYSFGRPGCAVVEHDTLLRIPFALLPESHDFLDLLLGRHTRRNVHVARVRVPEDLEHVPMLVGRRPDLNQVGLQAHDLASRSAVPN